MLIIKLSAIASTNSFLKDWVQQTKDYDAVGVWTEHQTKGRGRRDTIWLSSKGLNLTGSIYLAASLLKGKNTFELNKQACMAVYNTLNSYKTPELSIKWPNDILSGKKKLGGILMEPLYRGSELTGIVIGCGINVNQRDFPDLPCATSMAMLLDDTFSVETMFELLAKNIKAQLTSDVDVHKNYINVLFGYGNSMDFFRPDGTTFRATITDVSPTGSLILAHNDGKLEKFDEKEVIFKVSANCQ
jgi:BirA family biotin operon repressor/biotin-[acetyl-CoA-carboxylase] ligase